jgi:hypothetical protein
MRLVLTIDLDNAAFGLYSPKFRNGGQAARILRVLSYKLEDIYHLDLSASGKLLDGNGNTVGSWAVKEQGAS